MSARVRGKIEVVATKPLSNQRDLSLASKPVMEGKGCLFKKFAGVDVFDLELAENDPDKLIEAIAMLEPTVGGINLEDIKAPECFYIGKQLSARMNIPVFHDDQHGTAIISSSKRTCT